MHEPKPGEESVSTEIYLESRNQKDISKSHTNFLVLKNEIHLEENKQHLQSCPENTPNKEANHFFNLVLSIPDDQLVVDASQEIFPVNSNLNSSVNHTSNAKNFGDYSNFKS